MRDNSEHRLCVLVVEDVPTFRMVLRCGTERRFPGADVLEADSVSDGYGVAMENRPHAVVIDLGLPDGSGLELARRLRADLPGTALAVCTINDLAEYRVAARRCGVDAFFGKQEMDWHGIEQFLRAALSGEPAPGQTATANGEGAEVAALSSSTWEP